MIISKNISNNIEYKRQDTFIFYSILLMLVSLFISRAALSVSMIVFILLTLSHKNIFKQVKAFFNDRLLLMLSLLFFIPFISGLWSENSEQWSHVVRLKLPLLFMPLAFAGEWKLTKKQWELSGFFFLSLMFLACSWSLINYLLDSSAFNAEYLKAKLITTPLENDHVRFSWLTAIAVIWSFLLLEIIKDKWSRIILILLIIFFLIYLHILSARMGLFSLYIFLILFSLRLFLQMKKKLFPALVIGSLVIMPLIAWMLFPTFQNRIKYFIYDFSFVKTSTYKEGSNDGARINSIKAGWDMLQRNPLGAGAGDIYTETDKWYKINIPEVLPSDKFYPSNEWLMYGGFAGWAGVVLFTLIIFYPLVQRPMHFRFYWINFHVVAIFSFVFDMGLEVQYGVFLYTFILLWWYKWFNSSLHAE